MVEKYTALRQSSKIGLCGLPISIDSYSSCTFGCKYCCLYDEGWKRIGCVFCPMSSLRMKKMEIKRYPGFYKAYLKAFGKMLERHKERKLKYKLPWLKPEDVMEWWIFEKSKIKQDTLF